MFLKSIKHKQKKMIINFCNNRIIDAYLLKLENTKPIQLHGAKSNINDCKGLKTRVADLNID